MCLPVAAMYTHAHTRKASHTHIYCTNTGICVHSIDRSLQRNPGTVQLPLSYVIGQLTSAASFVFPPFSTSFCSAHLRLFITLAVHLTQSSATEKCLKPQEKHFSISFCEFHLKFQNDCFCPVHAAIDPTQPQDNTERKDSPIRDVLRNFLCVWIGYVAADKASSFWKLLKNRPRVLRNDKRKHQITSNNTRLNTDVEGATAANKRRHKGISTVIVKSGRS